MEKSLFLKAGLSQSQAGILSILLENGPQKAADAAKKAGLTRQAGYKILDELLALELVEKIDKGGKIAVFRPIHPSAMEKLFENKERQAKKDREEFLSELPGLVSLYNLSAQKPGVTYFEGDEGIERILEDGLASNTDICMYVDAESAMRSAEKTNERYGKKRKKLGIKKRIISPDTPFSRRYLASYNTDITEARLIPKEFFPFSTPSSLEIYDGKLSYVTIDEKSKIGVLLHDRNIYLLQKQFFEFAWKMAKPLSELS